MSSQLNVREEASPRPSLLERGPELPKGYGVTRLRLMARDSRWLHSYWEVAPDTWTEVEILFGPGTRASGKAILRFRAVGNGVLFDVGVRVVARNWYVRMPTQAGHWKAELGLMLPDGRFALLAVSNEVRMPAGRVSEEANAAWESQKSGWEKVHELSGGDRVGADSLGLARAMSRRWEFIGAVSSWRGNGDLVNREDNFNRTEREHL